MNPTHPLTTKTFELPGVRAVQASGMVREIAVRSRAASGNVDASIQILFGGNLSPGTERGERERCAARCRA